MIEVLESFVLGKAPDQELCEDAVYVNDHFAIVVDGATDKTGWSYEGRAGGRVAAQTCITVAASLPGDVPAEHFFSLVTEELESISAGGPPDGPSASIAVFSAHHREIWTLGDVGFLLCDGSEPIVNKKAIDHHAAAARAIYLDALLISGVDASSLRADDPGRAMIKPLLDSQYLFRNRPGPWGYGAIDGTPVPAQFIARYALPTEPTRVVMCSDGYPQILPSLADSEAALEDLLRTDPLCIGPLQGTKAWKVGNHSFDDRAYLKIMV